MTGLPKLALGAAVLAGERLTGRTSASSPVAMAIGLAQQGTARVVGAASKVGKARIKLPSLKQILHDAGARGAITMSRSRREAESTIRSALDGALPMVDAFVPKVIDRVLPQIRAKVLPAVVDDLSSDPKVRAMIAEQSQGVLNDATDELREHTAEADDRLESGVRRLFRGQ